MHLLSQMSVKYMFSSAQTNAVKIISCGVPFHTSSAVLMPKYRNIKKKVKIHKKKLTFLENEYNRLDVEDRPTGCLLCPHRNPDIEIDYKNVRLLSQFVSPHTGRIFGSRITGLCLKKQKEVRNAIMRAQQVGLMPVTMKYFDYHGDPKLF